MVLWKRFALESSAATSHFIMLDVYCLLHCLHQRDTMSAAWVATIIQPFVFVPLSIT
jgi:hypothetical protein